jgi:methionine-rich copper-binding protein CopC
MRRGPALLLVIGLTVASVASVAGVAGVAGPAFAHDQIVSSTPSPNETLTALPTQFAIDTNSALLDIGGSGRGFAFEIQDAGGKYYQTGCVSIVDTNLFTAARLGPPGKYTIIFQIVSGDGHTVSGEIPFTWAPSGTAVVTQGVADPPGCDGAKGPPKSNAADGGSEASRNSQVPLVDVLWIGGILLAVAAAVIVTLVVMTRRRRRDDGRGEADGPPAKELSAPPPGR